MSPRNTRSKLAAREEEGGRENEEVEEKKQSRATSVSTVKSPMPERESSPVIVKVEEGIPLGSAEALSGTKAEPISILDSVLAYPPGITLEALERIDGVVSFVDDNVPLYGIGALPSSAKWGTCASGRRADIDSYLCTKNRAFALWFVGRVHFVQLEESEDTYVVTFESLSNEHLRAAREVQYKRSSPAAEFPSHPYVQASKRNDGRVVFGEAYDVTEHLWAWSRMQKDKIDTTTINKKDTILVEAYVRRMKTDMGPKGKWSTWTVAMELERVAVLARMPVPMELPRDSQVNL